MSVTKENSMLSRSGFGWATLTLLLGAGCATAIDPSPLTYEGSSTIGENLMPIAAATFASESGTSFDTIGTRGSGAGFAAVMAGHVEIAGMSRSLKESEEAQTPFHRIIGYDAIAVFVHESNPVDNLTKDQLAAIFTGEVTNWAEVGGDDLEIEAVTELLNGVRATIEVFQDSVLDGAPYGPVTQIDKPAADVQHVAGNPSAITAAAMAFKVPQTKTVSIDGIEPTGEEVQNGAYLLSRPLLIVSRVPPTGSTKQFFDFMLTPSGQELVARSFVPVLR